MLNESIDGILIENVVLGGEREILIPVLIFRPSTSKDEKLPITVAFAQSGKAALLQNRTDEIAALLAGGIAVCLPDFRGIGETRPGTYRGRQSYATGISSSELMLGQTLLGSRLKDLRMVLAYLKSRPEFDKNRIALWGDSFADVNSLDRNVAVPLRIDDEPHQAEPLGHLLALLGALFDEDIAVVVSARGGITGFRSVLDSRFVYIPHDIVVPGALTTGDLNDIAKSLVPRPLRISGMVDGINRFVSSARSKSVYETVAKAYQANDAAENFLLDTKSNPDSETVNWLLKRLVKMRQKRDSD